MGETAAPLGRRERKKQETRAAIHSAALQLFASKGYREARVTDIADAADVSEATFFRYFNSKEDVALEGLMTRIDGVIDALRARPDDEPPLAACLAVMETPDALGLVPDPAETTVMQLLTQSRSLAGAYFWQMTQVGERLAGEFARRLGVPPTDLEPHLLASSVIGALSAVLRVWLADPVHTKPFQLTQQAFRRLASGLEPDL